MKTFLLDITWKVKKAKQDKKQYNRAGAKALNHISNQTSFN